MFQNYLKIATRNLLKNTGFSLINIAGLAIGIASCLLIVLFVANELSYDRWNPHAERIWRPWADINFGGSHEEMAVTNANVAPDVVRELPEVQTACRLRDYGSFLVRRDGEGLQNFREEKVLTADSTFFEVFPLPILEGDPRRCLALPKTLALSRSRADKYFGSPQLAVGQTLVLDNEEGWQVSAVFEDMPVNCHFRADLLLAMNGNEEVAENGGLWFASNNFHTYFLLRKGADVQAFQQKFAAMSREKANAVAQALLGASIEEFEKTGAFARYQLQPLTGIHLRSDLGVELAPNGSIRYVWIFSAIAAFLLLIACINFMNLSTARSTGRAKEVGVRKVLGSGRRGLVGQFLSESTLLTAIAILLAVQLAAFTLPWFNELAGRQLAMPWSEPLFWLSLLGTVGVVGLLAGSYPAFFISAFDAIEALKGTPSRGQGVRHGVRHGVNLRNALVVFQFTTSVALIIGTMLVFRQLNFISEKKVGFKKEQVLILDDAYALGEQVATFKEEMLKLPAVERATVSSYLPVPSNRSDQGFSKIRDFDEKNTVSMQRWRTDSDYLPTLGMELVQGRNFDPARITDSTAVILNETAARLFGFDDPIGKKIYTLLEFRGGNARPEDFTELTVIGVVKDFHWASLRENIGALCLHFARSRGNISFRYKSEATAEVLAALENNWKKMAPGQPFNYRFMDDSFARMYDAERRTGKVAGVFALLSVFVSCLGLFGLASYLVEQRRKEIGVRKVLGATVAGVVGLLSKEFLKPVFIALVIASPLAWYFMNEWLQDFAYRIDIQWTVFAVAGVLAVVVAFLTVSFQSVNPDSYRER
ncbi:MAG: ABC transporter permease [Actinomycetota bacterium]